MAAKFFGHRLRGIMYSNVSCWIYNNPTIINDPIFILTYIRPLIWTIFAPDILTHIADRPVPTPPIKKFVKNLYLSLNGSLNIFFTHSKINFMHKNESLVKLLKIKLSFVLNYYEFLVFFCVSGNLLKIWALHSLLSVPKTCWLRIHPYIIQIMYLN